MPHEPYVGFEPDIRLGHENTLSLEDFGVHGIVRHTAGHTAGSISVELSSQDVLVGDLVASGILTGGIAFQGRAMRPPFEDDPLTVAKELERLVHGGAERFYMGHGGPLNAEAVLRHARYLKHISHANCGSGHCDHSH